MRTRFRSAVGNRLLAGKKRQTLAAVIVVCAVASGVAWAATQALHAGFQPDGTAITPQGWRVTPAGRQTALGSGPLAVAVSPDGEFALVANAGYGNHSLMVIDSETGAVRQTIGTNSNALRAEGSNGPERLPVHSYYPPGAGVTGYYTGIVFSPDGTKAYASDGPGSGIHTFTVSRGRLTEGSEIQLHGRVWPAGIAVSGDGSRLFVAGNMADQLLIVDPFSRKRAAVIPVPVGHLPYAVVLNHSGSLAYVSSWGGHTVSVVDTAAATVVATLDVGLHPSAMALNPTSTELYVANTDSDTISVIDSETATELRTIDLHFAGNAHVGASPNGLAVSPDGERLYVANAGVNCIAVVDLAPTGSTQGDEVAGEIPTGWYPADVALDPAGSRLFVVNMKGLAVGPVGPGQYVGLMLSGTLSRISVPTESELDDYTQQVVDNSRVQEAPPANDGSVVPTYVGGESPVKHVIYVLKENRTYDQVLGDLEKGDGDPDLVMYPEQVTPNQHELARRFVTLDNFYCDAEVSADGWSWSNSAYANTYIQKNWPLDYNIWTRPYDFGWAGDEETAGFPGDPDDAFLWDRLHDATPKIDYVNYGFFMNGLPIEVPDAMPNLIGHTDLGYSGWDLKYSDQDRIDYWLTKFAGYEAAGEMPTVQFVYLPRDHTMVTATGQPQPTAMVADNDLALGRLVEAVSHSEFWQDTAIFVVEDDAQDGPDHVDSHRTVAQVISPYSQHATVDSTFYSTVSMLRTMELILGVEPMTIFDATATPMSACFSATPNEAPYDAIIPGTSLTATNSAGAPMAAIASRLDFSRPDALPEELVNEALWKDIKGADSEMPEPVKSLGM